MGDSGQKPKTKKSQLPLFPFFSFFLVQTALSFQISGSAVTGGPNNGFSHYADEFCGKDPMKCMNLKTTTPTTPEKKPGSTPLPAVTGVILIPKPLSNQENSDGWKGDVSHDETLDLIAGRLFERPTTKEGFDNLKRNLRPILLKRLKELSEMKPITYEVGLEMGDSVYLLKLLGSSNPKFDIVGEKAGIGAMLLQKGVSIVTEGQDQLRSAIIDMSTSTE